MADGDAPAVAVATGSDAPSTEELTAADSAAAAGAAGVLAGQAEESAAQADAAAAVAAQGAMAAMGAEESAAIAGEAAAQTSADRSALEAFIESQTAVNQAVVTRLAELSAPPPAPPADDKPTRDKAPGKSKPHFLERRIGGGKES